MFIDINFLIYNKACKEQIDLFANVFPNGAETTPLNLRFARKEGLKIVWLEQFIPFDCRPEYEEQIMEIHPSQVMANLENTLSWALSKTNENTRTN